ncbi:hypothetical protein RHSIM_Rhsim07G0190900 [Rhododendron simsii]|uniref:Uncharacterized protein n=1 Tax=Rhododendron simsii TaxID=118357 RepID=A0A834LJJ9_RHOSS|nr:hypothetical protein RHSIM_Rhsim07G0190900 [Rhododendron simsii]
MRSCSLHTLTFIFFPALNGNPPSRDSLHYIGPSGRLNAYQQVRCCDFLLGALVEGHMTVQYLIGSLLPESVNKDDALNAYCFFMRYNEMASNYNVEYIAGGKVVSVHFRFFGT